MKKNAIEIFVFDLFKILLVMGSANLASTGINFMALFLRSFAALTAQAFYGSIVCNSLCVRRTHFTATDSQFRTQSSIVDRLILPRILNKFVAVCSL